MYKTPAKRLNSQVCDSIDVNNVDSKTPSAKGRTPKHLKQMMLAKMSEARKTKNTYTYPHTNKYTQRATTTFNRQVNTNILVNIG